VKVVCIFLNSEILLKYFLKLRFGSSGPPHTKPMGVGGGVKAPLEFENFRNKSCILSFEREKPNFTTLGSPRKIFGKSR